MNIKIQSITEAYTEGFREAVGAVARERKFLAFLDAPSPEMTKLFVTQNIKENWPHVIAIDPDENNQVVGWCDITSLNRPAFEHSGALGIGVIKAYRGQGLGKALMQAALKLAQTKGLTRIELTVRENNHPAIKLYQSLGFVTEGLHKNAVRIDGQYENQLFMALLF